MQMPSNLEFLQRKENKTSFTVERQFVTLTMLKKSRQTLALRALILKAVTLRQN